MYKSVEAFRRARTIGTVRVPYGEITKWPHVKFENLRYLWFNEFRLSKGPHLGSTLLENRIYGGQLFSQAWRALQIHLNDCGKNLELHTLSHTFIAPGYTVNTLSVLSSAKSKIENGREKSYFKSVTFLRAIYLFKNNREPFCTSPILDYLNDTYYLSCWLDDEKDSWFLFVYFSLRISSIAENLGKADEPIEYKLIESLGNVHLVAAMQHDQMISLTRLRVCWNLHRKPSKYCSYVQQMF